MEDNRVPSFVAVDPATASMSNALRGKRKRNVVEEPQKAQKPRRKMLRRRGQNSAATKEVEIESLGVSEEKGLDAMELDMAVAVTAAIATEGEAGAKGPEIGDVNMVTETQVAVEETKVVQESVIAKHPEGEQEEDDNKTDVAEKPVSKTETAASAAAANDKDEQPPKEGELTEAVATPVPTEAKEQQEGTAAAAEKDAANPDEPSKEEATSAPTETNEEKEEDVDVVAAVGEEEAQDKDSESEASTAVETEEPKAERKSWLASAFGKVFSFW